MAEVFRKPAVGTTCALLWAAAIAVLGAGCTGHPASTPTGAAGATRQLPNVRPGQQAPLIGFITTSNGQSVARIPASYLFSLDSAKLLPAAVAELRNLLPAIRSSSAQVLILGWTDGLGSIAHNKILSQERAASVAAWLASNNVDQRRINAMGMGEATSKIDPSQRRVEIVLR